MPFYGFCSRNPDDYKNGHLGKPVCSHSFLIQNMGSCYCILPTVEHYGDAVARLEGCGFPEEKILPYFCGKYMAEKRAYFEFPEFFKEGTSFVDGGCYDGATSLEFAQWSKGKYNKIFAFEPDQANVCVCRQRVENQHLCNFNLIPAGLSRKNERLAFSSGKGPSSCIITDDRGSVPTEKNYIDVVNLDSVVGEETIGFIKLDIEGAEYEALCGAENIITRDKPLLAVCVYHRPGDQLALMDYLHALVPEYRFWLRHYSMSSFDTVLYAAAP